MKKSLSLSQREEENERVRDFHMYYTVMYRAHVTHSQFD